MNNRKIEKEIEILLDKSRLTPSSRMLKLKEKFPIVSEADSRHQLWDFDSHDIRLAKIYASLQIEDKKRNPEYNPYDERNPEQKMGDAFWGLLGEIAFEQFLWESGLLYYWARRRLGYFERKEPYDFLIPLKSGKVRKLEIITTPDYAKAVISDDKAFLKVLSKHNIPFITPSNIIVSFVELGIMTRKEGLRCLNILKPYVSKETYLRARRIIEGGG